jgi:hypothetical protein
LCLRATLEELAVDFFSDQLPRALSRTNQLRTLDLQAASTVVTDGVITAMVKTFRQVLKVEKRKCCRKLQRFVAHGPLINSTGLRAIAGWFTNLRYVDLIHTGFIDAGIVGIVTLCRIVSLDVTSTWIGSDGFKAIAKNCPNLQELDVTDTALVDDDVIAIVAKCSQLKFLGVGTTQLTDNGVAAIGQCSQLLRLNATDLVNIGDKGIKGIAKCQLLRHLQMEEASLITDVGISAIALGCPQLRYLAVFAEFSDIHQAVNALSMNCVWLEYLNLGGCNADCVRSAQREGLLKRLKDEA